MMSMPKSPSLKATALQSREAIELLSDKWRIAVLHLLTKRVLRTGELQTAIENVSPKMLTQTLRGMERDGLITRTVYAETPARVEYQLTRMGASILGPIRELCHWAKRMPLTAMPREDASILPQSAVTRITPPSATCNRCIRTPR